MRIIQEDTAFAREATLVSEVLTEEAGCSITGYTWSNGNAGAAVTAHFHADLTGHPAPLLSTSPAHWSILSLIVPQKWTVPDNQCWIP